MNGGFFLENIYQKLYYFVFNEITDALEEMENQNFGKAKDILQTAQQKAEELYLEQEENMDSF